MKTIINLIFAVGNLFLSPLVFYYIWLWFSPHVGFDLPTLTYWNMFALILLKQIVSDYRGQMHLHAIFLSLSNEKQKDSVKEWVYTLIILIIWGMSSLYHTLFF